MNRRNLIQTLIGNSLALPFLTQCTTTQTAGQGKFGIGFKYGALLATLSARTPDAEGSITPFAEDTLNLLKANNASGFRVIYEGSATLSRETNRDRFGPGFGATLNSNDQRTGHLRVEFSCRKSTEGSTEVMRTEDKSMVNGQVIPPLSLPARLWIGNPPVYYTEKAAILHMIGEGQAAPLVSGRWKVDENVMSMSNAGSMFVPALGKSVTAWRWRNTSSGRNYVGQRLVTSTETLLSSEVPGRVISLSYQQSYDGIVTKRLNFSFKSVSYT